MSETPVQYADRPDIPLRSACSSCGKTERLVTDHCHAHGWVRAIVCPSCNRRLGSLDRGIAPPVGQTLLDALLAVWHRCHECAALGDPLSSLRRRLRGNEDDGPARLRLALAGNVRAERARAGMTQGQVAKAMEVLGYQWHHRTVGQIECGDRQVTADEMNNLASVLGTDPGLLWRVP